MIEKKDDSAIKVIFICYGNACRSAMAEMICNAYGKGEVVSESAGVHPALPYIEVDQPTIIAMREIGIDISCHKPKHIRSLDLSFFDVLINMSPLPSKDLLKHSRTFKGIIIEWAVIDPRGRSPMIYRKVRDDLKKKVLDLIKTLTAR